MNTSAYILRRKALGKGSTTGIVSAMQNKIPVIRNDSKMPTEECLVIRWGCTSNVPQKNVLNKASAIHLVSNKAKYRMDCMEKGVPCPRSTQSADLALEWIAQGKSLVIRPTTHAQGKNLYLVKTPGEFHSAIAKCGGGWYAGEFINKVAEYRVFVAQGRAVWVARKTPADEKAVAWNVAQGGKFENVRWKDWPLNVVKTAVEAHAITGLDFSGIDIMVDNDDRSYVLEANSAPSQTSPYRQSCVAKVFDYILANGKESIPVGQKGYYLRYIHPALDSQAFC